MKAGCCVSDWGGGGRGEGGDRGICRRLSSGLFVSFKLLSFYSFHSRFLKTRNNKLESNVEKFKSIVFQFSACTCSSCSNAINFFCISVLCVPHLTPVCVPVCIFYFSVSHSLVLVDEEVSLLLFRVSMFPGNCAPTITVFFIFLSPFILLFVSLCFTYFCL